MAKKAFYWVAVALLILIVSFVGATLFRFYFARPIKVVGTSMYPTLENNELIYINTTKKINLGDIVVFYYSDNPSGENPAKDYHSVHMFVRSMPIIGKTVKTESNTDWTLLVKRVVGMPNDTVELRSEEVGGIYYIFLYRNGEKVEENFVMFDETYIDDYDTYQATLNAENPHYISSTKPYTLGEDEYYMLGDNRGGSKDSRYFGGIKKYAIVGVLRS